MDFIRKMSEYFRVRWELGCACHRRNEAVRAVRPSRYLGLFRRQAPGLDCSDQQTGRTMSRARGRPRKEIDLELVEGLLNSSVSMQEVADLLEVLIPSQTVGHPEQLCLVPRRGEASAKPQKLNLVLGGAAIQ